MAGLPTSLPSIPHTSDTSAAKHDATPPAANATAAGGGAEEKESKKDYVHSFGQQTDTIPQVLSSFP